MWALFFVYAACFGIELTINNIAAIYYMDYFDLGLKTAGLVAGLFGLMNIFARTMGGFISDKFVEKGGLKGRVRWLFIALLVEGIALLFFSQMRVLALAIPAMIVFSLFVQMSEGATYSVVPFINKKALGSVAGIVGAGGNMGAVCCGLPVSLGKLQLSASALDSRLPGDACSRSSRSWCDSARRTRRRQPTNSHSAMAQSPRGTQRPRPAPRTHSGPATPATDGRLADLSWASP